MRLSLRRLTSKAGPALSKTSKRDLGKAGEATARMYLKRLGYVIIEKNYATRLGEIDIIARDGSVIVFVEVKTRSHETYCRPEESVNAKKKHKLTILALSYIKRKGFQDKRARFDVVSVCPRCGSCHNKIRLIKNAFSIRSCYDS